MCINATVPGAHKLLCEGPELSSIPWPILPVSRAADCESSHRCKQVWQCLNITLFTKPGLSLLTPARVNNKIQIH